MNTKTYQVTYNEETPERLDKFLAEKLTEISRSRIQKIIEQGNVKINELIVSKSNTQINLGTNIQVLIPEIDNRDLEGENIDLDIIYVDQDTIVVNKPAGIVVYPGAGDEKGTIIHGLIQRYPELLRIGERDRPGIVHRLDKDTSGVLLIARTQLAYEWFVSQFRSRKTQKTYMGLVDGKPPTPEGRIEVPILRDPKRRQKMSVGLSGQGRKAITEYYQVREYSKHVFLRFNLITGRTHQIRVHMSYLGCPIVGDTIYGYKHPSLQIGRFFLHARELQIRLPGNKKPSVFRTDLPEELKKILEDLD